MNPLQTFGVDAFLIALVFVTSIALVGVVLYLIETFVKRWSRKDTLEKLPGGETEQSV